ncbi:MAG: tetratricopeptide repeat protein [bacterium]
MNRLTLVITAVLSLSLILFTSCKSPELAGGIIALNAGRFDEALEDFLIAKEKEPNNPEVYIYLAKVYANKQMWNEAIETLSQGEGKNPKFDKQITLARQELWVKIYNDFAIPAFAEKNYEKAIEYFILCTKADPNMAEAFNSLGLCYSMTEKPEEAVKAFEKAVELHPDKIDYLTNLSSAYIDTGNIEKASEILYILSEKEPDNADVQYKVARTLHLHNKVDEAIEKYRKVIELDPEYLDAYYYLGSVLQDEKEDYKGAVEILEKYVEKFDSDEVAWARLAQCYNKLGQKDKAIEAAKKAEDIIKKKKEEGGGQ